MVLCCNSGASRKNLSERRVDMGWIIDDKADYWNK
jgi:hypothetical protein